MSLPHVEYPLQNGWIQNWLVAGPLAVSFEPRFTGETAVDRARSAAQLLGPVPEAQDQPCEPGPIAESTFRVDEQSAVWSYYRCGEDHFIHRSTHCPEWQLARGWAYVCLHSQNEQEVLAALASFGPLDAWVNGHHAHHFDAFALAEPLVSTFRLRLRPGDNDLLIRFANAARGDCPLILSAQVRETAGEITARIPSRAGSIQRRSELEPVIYAAYAGRDVFGAGQMLSLHWPFELPHASPTIIRFQTPGGRIYSETEASGLPGETISNMQAAQFPDGRWQYFLMPRPQEMYEANIRMTRALDVWIAAGMQYVPASSNDFSARQEVCLRYAARQAGGLAGEIARMALGQWSNVKGAALQASIEAAARNSAGSLVDLASLISAVLRYGQEAAFPAGLAEQVHSAAAGFRYDLAAENESQEILSVACAILAGQMLPEQPFASGLSGQQVRTQAEQQALRWMQSRGSGGLEEWGSPAAFAEICQALALLIDHAESEPVWEMASVLLDTLLFDLALRSFAGVYAASRRRVSSIAARSGRMLETAGIAYLMLGAGVCNPHLSATLELALLKNYELPPIFAQIASDPQELWSRERHAPGSPAEANTVTYRTADYLLSSAQDYRPGAAQCPEQPWLAVLDPDVIVFTSHPAYSEDQPALPAGYWTGNGALPRVAQWKDTLLALYRLPEGDRLGFTHAYFPTAGMDEWALEGDWAFARKGSAYLALYASSGLELVRQGARAMRELRSGGPETVWLCQMGSAAQDGHFAAFQEKVRSMPLQIDGLTVSLANPRGDRLAFDWQGPFLVNDSEVALHGFPYHDNRYCSAQVGAEELEVKTGDYLLRILLGAPGAGEQD